MFRYGESSRDIAVKLAEDALRDVIGFDEISNCQFADAGDESPVAADHALHQPVVAQVVEAARLPVAQAPNLTRTLKDWAKAGAQIVGLDTEGAVSLDEYDGTGPTVIVVGSEGKGLSRLVRETCDSVLAIPMAGDVESLNASVAAGVVLADFARQRRQS